MIIPLQQKYRHLERSERSLTTFEMAAALTEPQQVGICNSDLTFIQTFTRNEH